jgi:L(+)-tartrate dehydratase alpha subunit
MENEKAAQAMADILSKFISFLGKKLPDDVLAKLIELRSREDTPLAKVVYDSMFENLDKAIELDRPACQDTGVINFFIKAGAKFPYLGQMKDVLIESVRIATIISPLRHNTVKIFDEVNDGTNIGERAPFVHWDIVGDGDDIEVEAYMAGGGCSLPGRAITLMPSAGYEGIVKYVFDTMVDWGINACPPLIVGIGIAGSVENASILSKKAILRPIGTSNPNPKGAGLEKLLEEGLNELGLGAQGLSGKSTVMGVHIESAARHPSTIAVGINVGCWAHRRGTIQFKKDLSYKVISHKGVTL